MIHFINCINLITSHHMLLAVQDLPFSFKNKIKIWDFWLQKVMFSKHFECATKMKNFFWRL